MRQSTFRQIGAAAPVITGNDFPAVDQFCVSDFFTDGGLMLKDVDVFARADTNPELRAKINQYMIENEVKGLSDEMDVDDAFDAVEERLSLGSALAAVKSRLSELYKSDREAKKQKASE